MSIQRALLSVSDKTGLVEFARSLVELGVEILSTGGTAKSLRDAGLAVIDVSEITGFPEILDGRVKTLHPHVHAALLAKGSDPAHVKTLEDLKITPIDLVVVNLYPFEETAAREDAAWKDLVEKIDVGGPTMLRAAAKNHERVTVICDPADYAGVLEEVRQHGNTTPETRRQLAIQTFRRTAAYDAAISATLEQRLDPGATPPLPSVWVRSYPRQEALRYGENPHQRAAFYRDPLCRETSVASAKQLQGKQLSYNNILDAEGALEMARDFAELAPAAVVIVKHSNPCGIAIGSSVREAYDRARACDPDSAFGGIIASSVVIDGATAAGIAETFNEVVIAPGYTEEARATLAPKKNLRLLETGPFTPRVAGPLVRGVVGGLLVMDRDLGSVARGDLRVVGTQQPSDADLDALLFAWRCVKWVKSNAIVYTSAHATIGIGAGQMSRVDASRVGAEKARTPLAGSYMASDAFFPFRDNVDTAAGHGVRAIIQPGGSVRDEEVIAAANEHGIILVFTGMRHFRH